MWKYKEFGYERMTEEHKNFHPHFPEYQHILGRFNPLLRILMVINNFPTPDTPHPCTLSVILEKIPQLSL